MCAEQLYLLYTLRSAESLEETHIHRVHFPHLTATAQRCGRLNSPLPHSLHFSLKVLHQGTEYYVSQIIGWLLIYSLRTKIVTKPRKQIKVGLILLMDLSDFFFFWLFLYFSLKCIYPGGKCISYYTQKTFSTSQSKTFSFII